jgi:hypothetical protein
LRYFWIFVYFILAATAFAASDACIECHRDWPEYAEWKESSHKSAGVTCVNCHGGDTTVTSMDAVRSTEDYIDLTDKRNVPGVCAGCHSDFTMMKQYGLPTDQMDQYLTSRHGDRLVNFGDVNVASCADCHGAHAIHPSDHPESAVNRLNIPGVCAECHSDPDIMNLYNLPSDTYDKYANSVHGEQLLEMEITGVAVCVDCHGNHGASPPGVSEIRNICGQCHINQADFFKQSPHSEEVTIKEANGASDCAACHDYHSIKKPEHIMWTGADDGNCGNCHEPGSTAYIRAENILKNLTDAEASINETKAAIKEAAKMGIFVEELENRLKEAETSLTEAYPAAHTLDLSTVTERTKEAIKTAHDVESEIIQFQHELEKRRNILIGVLIGIAILLLILEIKRRRMFKKLLKAETDNAESS